MFKNLLNKKASTEIITIVILVVIASAFVITIPKTNSTSMLDMNNQAQERINFTE